MTLIRTPHFVLSDQGDKLCSIIYYTIHDSFLSFNALKQFHLQYVLT